MSVTTVSDEIELKPDCIFVLTNSAILTVKQRRLFVRHNANRRERKPIDIFFSSLAADVGELAAGIVLSGGDGDGTLGIKAIKERGGLTFAQTGDGFGPGHPDMPDSAIATGFVDFAIPADEMGEKLVQFARGGLYMENLLGQLGAIQERGIFSLAQAADRPTRFIRVMILPRAYLGKSSVEYLNDEDKAKPKSQNYKIFVDLPIEGA